MALTRLNNRSISAVTALPTGIDIPTGAIVPADLPSKSILQVVHNADATEQVTTPGAWVWVTLGSWGGSITMVNSANRLLIIGNINAASQGNQGAIRVQYSTNSGSTWNEISGNATATSAGSNTHGQLYQYDSVHANESHGIVLSFLPAATNVSVRAQGIVDSASNLAYNRSPSNDGIGSNGVSGCTLIEIAA